MRRMVVGFLSGVWAAAPVAGDVYRKGRARGGALASLGAASAGPRVNPAMVGNVAFSEAPERVAGSVGAWLCTLLLVLAACTGPVGPAGPGTRLAMTGELDAQGSAVVPLPAEVGTQDDPPALTCYIGGAEGDGLWFTFSQSEYGWCALEWAGTHWDARLIDVMTDEPGVYMIVVVY